MIYRAFKQPVLLTTAIFIFCTSSLVSADTPNKDTESNLPDHTEHAHTHSHSTAHDHESMHQHAADPSIGAKGNPADADRVIDVTLGDMKYNLKEIQVKAGETVKFNVKNVGSVIHEFTIGTPKMHKAHQTEMIKMIELGHMSLVKLNPDKKHSETTMQHDEPNSVLVEPGQAGALVWKFGDNQNMEFACNVPGHYQAGMYGKIIIKK